MDESFWCGIRNKVSNEKVNSSVVYMKHELPPGLRKTNRSKNHFYFRYLEASDSEHHKTSNYQHCLNELVSSAAALNKSCEVVLTDIQCVFEAMKLTDKDVDIDIFDTPTKVPAVDCPIESSAKQPPETINMLPHDKLPDASGALGDNYNSKVASKKGKTDDGVLDFLTGIDDMVSFHFI